MEATGCGVVYAVGCYVSKQKQKQQNPALLKQPLSSASPLPATSGVTGVTGCKPKTLVQLRIRFVIILFFIVLLGPTGLGVDS